MIVSIANPIYDSVFKHLMEDEFFSAIENRDTAIMMRDKKIAEQTSQLEQQTAQLEQQQNALLQSAQAMKSAGVDNKRIATITGLTEETIADL